MDCFNPYYDKEKGALPCGKCLPCLKRRQDDWSFRLQIENQHSINTLFVTLTYEEEKKPHATSYQRRVQSYPYWETVQTSKPFGTLSKRDLQLWLKRLRKSINGRIRYFACGEYGPKTHRPHYHVIIFNYPNVKKAYEEINRSWNKGFITVKRITDGHFDYVAKYAAMSMDLPEHLRDKRYRPFILCSRRPAIGSQYLTDRMVTYHRETLATVGRLNGFKYSLPKYFKDKLFDDAMKADIKEKVDEYRRTAYTDYQSRYFEYDYKTNNESMVTQQRADWERRYRDKLFKSKTPKI